MSRTQCKFAANLTMMFKELPFLERFSAAAKAGFKAVEFLSPYEYSKEELLKQLQQNNLQLVLFNSAMGDISKGEWGLNAIPGREKDARENIHTALDYAIALKCPTIHLMAAVVPPDADYALYQQTFIDNVRYAAELYQKHNISIVLEALSPIVKPNYLFSSQFQSAELVKLINRPNVFIQFDVFHAQNVDGNITRLFEQMKDKIKHIQIASVPDRHEPDEGEIDYAYIFNLFEQNNYSDWIGCEYNPRANTQDGLLWLKNIVPRT
ncbi:2-oxo-tetronate isomerase [Gilliamella sp. wkB112]|uniref:2-oxo-tetronate isomerase n=1 Tax=Gilliamella sp. wkB112 TaxID=3120257 RepID=UPI00080EE530|nr:2-oxo-tetronate isomerase [Gilliamella apicola]OCG03985.1 hydroxypyruvate isomerase [Gilliamella apicola]